MCRYNQLWGIALIAFAVGIFVGTCLEGGFWSSCFALGVAAVGFGFLRR